MVANAFNAAFDAMAGPAFLVAGLATAATFRRRGTTTDIPCTILVDDGIQLIGDQSQVINDQTTVTAFAADIGSPDPAHGDKFTLDDRVLIVDSISNKDESRFVCIVKNG